MANQEHLEILKQGTATWNTWRKQHPKIRPDLSGANLTGVNPVATDLILPDFSGAWPNNTHIYRANLSGANLSGADLSGANLKEANLKEANLKGTNLSFANLSDADLGNADLSGADLREANLREANLSRANLGGANLGGADLTVADLYEANLSRATLSRANLGGANFGKATLSRANLSQATLVRTNLTEAILTECHIYGISAWDIELTGATQDSLVITPEDEPQITVDNLKIAQFIYLLLNNEEIRDVIDTIAKKAVLILGRFTPERKVVLDTLREALRRHGYLPILFDFEKPSSRNFTETIRILAHLSRFIIADLTDPSSIPQELYAIVPTLAVPVQPLLEATKREYSMFADFKRYHWVLPVHHYTNLPDLLAAFEERIIDPAERKAQELTQP